MTGVQTCALPILWAFWEPKMCASQSIKEMCWIMRFNLYLQRPEDSKKNRYGRLRFESGHILCEKIEKGVPYHHPKATGPKPKTWKFSPFRVPNWPYGSEHSFMFGCRLDSSFRVFWLVFVPRHVFILCLWFFF